MKKLMIMVAMMVASAAAFAGDSPALKEILKAKTYAEAEALLKSNLGQLANDAEKAKAYNKLVDLAYEKFKKEDDTKTTNQVMQKNDPVDTEGMILAGRQALKAALECEKYDSKPNEKGKVAPKFRKNGDRLQTVRTSILNVVQDLSNDNKNNKDVLEICDLYLKTSAKQPFVDEDAAKKEPNYANYGYAGFFGGRAAVQLEDYAKANELFKLGLQDTTKQTHDLCFEFLLYTMRQSQKTAADSAKYINDMQALYAEYPNNDQVFGNLTDAYMAKGENAKVIALADQHLAKNPQAALPHVYKAFLLMQDKKYDESIAEFDKVPESAPSYLQCVYNRAVCKYNKAADFNEANSDIRTGRLTPENEKTYKSYLEAAQKDFEKAQQLDPDQMTVKWGYLLKNVYRALGQQDKADAIL